MEREHSDSDGLSPCGHHNLRTSHFCDVCGVKLPEPCPRCHTVNRSGANFCRGCGIDLRAVGTEALSTPREYGPATLSETAAVSRPKFVDLLLRRGSGDTPVEDEPGDVGRVERIQRFLRGRRRRRSWAWLGPASVVAVLTLLVAALVRSQLATPSRDQHPRAALTQTSAQGVSRPEPRNGGLREDHSQAGAPPPPTPERSPASTPADPRAGGELTFVVPSEPPSYDAHREETFALIHPAAPHYNTLLRIDPFDTTGTRIIGDLATSWTVSPDKRTYVLKLRRGVKFHDGSEMTSRDVRATYEKIINPPLGVKSARKGEYLEIETVQAPERYIVAFKLRWPSPSFIDSLASPWNWVYKADILERDVRWYETNVMGTGPFTFVEHVKGSHWSGRRNPDYWDRGRPYLDGYRALFLREDAAQAEAIRSGRAHIQFRGFSPAQRDDLVRALGDKVTVQESAWNCGLVVAINHEQPPFHDRRVRRALSLALDRYGAAAALSRIAIVREVAGVQVPGTAFATPSAELVKLAGYGRDIQQSRMEARRLLAEAGIGEGISFVLKNRDIPMPYAHIGTWLVDQWRQIGLTVHQEIRDSGQYFKDLRTGNFELSTDFQCGYVVDPDLDLYKFQSQERSDANYSRYTDPVLDDLYVRQSRTVDPERRREYIRAFEKRLLDEEAHYIYTLQWHRIVPHSSRIHGWTITPSHYLNNQLDTVWLAE